MLKCFCISPVKHFPPGFMCFVSSMAAKGVGHVVVASYRGGVISLPVPPLGVSPQPYLRFLPRMARKEKYSHSCTLKRPHVGAWR